MNNPTRDDVKNTIRGVIKTICDVCRNKKEFPNNVKADMEYLISSAKELSTADNTMENYLLLIKLIIHCSEMTTQTFFGKEFNQAAYDVCKKCGLWDHTAKEQIDAVIMGTLMDNEKED